jgi:hypothetical protein
MDESHIRNFIGNPGEEKAHYKRADCADNAATLPVSNRRIAFNFLSLGWRMVSGE